MAEFIGLRLKLYTYKILGEKDEKRKQKELKRFNPEKNNIRRLQAVSIFFPKSDSNSTSDPKLKT